VRYPNEVQSALLFDRRLKSLDAMVKTFLNVHQAQTGVRLNVPEAKPGAFYRLFGGGDLMVTMEYIDRPADMAVFQQPLTSTVTGIIFPDVRQRLTTCRSHILVNVSHGVLGSVAGDPKIAAMLQQIGMPQEGHSLGQFKQRLETLGLISRIVNDAESARAVHWTQSNMLFPGEALDALVSAGIPGNLHVHPYLFGTAKTSSGKPHVGIRTFGARHFIGREILVEPNELPWAANLETILAFLRVATIDNGYVIPDGDTFGPEDGSLSYRVVHRQADEGDVALFELIPLLHREFGFEAADYVPRERVFDDRRPPDGLMPAGQDAKQQLVNEWREKRAMAEGIGGRFEVRARHGDATTPSPVPPRSPGFFGRRGTFGRKSA